MIIYILLLLGFIYTCRKILSNSGLPLKQRCANIQHSSKCYIDPTFLKQIDSTGFMDFNGNYDSSQDDINHIWFILYQILENNQILLIFQTFKDIIKYDNKTIIDKPILKLLNNNDFADLGLTKRQDYVNKRFCYYLLKDKILVKFVKVFNYNNVSTVSLHTININELESIIQNHNSDANLNITFIDDVTKNVVDTVLCYRHLLK